MTSFEGSGEHKVPFETEPFRLLVDQIIFTVDDALDLVAQKIDEDKLRIQHQRRKAGLVEYVQMDTISLQGQALRVLLTASGGKPEVGVEKIRLLAHPTRQFESVADAAIANVSESGLAFMMNEFYIAHQSEDGQWRYSYTDGSGIYPWVPNFITSDQNETPDALSGDDAIEYAQGLLQKLVIWDIVPQN